MPNVITERQAEAVARLAAAANRAYDLHDVFRSAHLVAPGSA